jgi:hypothetical protein
MVVSYYLTDKLSHTVTAVRAGFEPPRAGGERSRGMRLDHGGPYIE